VQILRASVQLPAAGQTSGSVVVRLAERVTNKVCGALAAPL